MQTNQSTQKGALASVSTTTLNETIPASSSVVGFDSQYAYHEMADVPVREVDVVEQLQANLSQLQDLSQRYSFMMREIRYMMKI